MKSNLVFYFSGTGNCLQVAKTIAETLPNCEIISMSSCVNFTLQKDYDTVGFVYPTYFQGIPLQAEKFISALKVNQQQLHYCYAITTYGAMAGNALPQVKKLLAGKGIHLDYGEKLVMFSNYVVMYNMSTKVEKKTEKSAKMLEPIIQNIKCRYSNRTSDGNPLLEWYYRMRAKSIPSMDKNFNVSENCTGCRVCEKACPVSNIAIENRKPVFRHHCEQCMACIQFCPKTAINYKNATKKRRRYTNPTVTYQELCERNHFHQDTENL